MSGSTQLLQQCHTLLGTSKIYLLHPCGKHTCDWKTAVFRQEKHRSIMPVLRCYTALLESSRWLRLLISPRKNPFLSVVRDKLHRQTDETKHFPQTSPKKHKIPYGRGRSGCFTGPWPVKKAWRIWWVIVYP